MNKNLWNDTIQNLAQESKSFIIGLFAEDGVLISSNKGFQNLFELVDSPKDIFINPTLEQLIKKNADQEETFNGVVTLGDGKRNNFSIEAKVFKKENEVLIVGDFDVRNLVSNNLRMADLNQEISNLQRELIKEKKVLQTTLNKLKETQNMLIHSEKMNALGQLVAGVAHEINNPIAFVSSNLHFLKEAFEDFHTAYISLEKLLEECENPPLVEKMNKIRKDYDIDYLFEDFEDLEKGSYDGLMRVKKIVDNLKIFSRLDESKFQESDLIENIRATILVANPEYKKRHISIEFDCDRSLFIECYPSELNQVFLNIIINACQALKNDEGVLKIEIENREKDVLVKFIDNGCGIPKDIQAKIFDPFFTTKPVGSGTGLGLSLAYNIIVNKHKGKIEVDSTENIGTTFTLLLPKKLREKE